MGVLPGHGERFGRAPRRRPGARHVRSRAARGSPSKPDQQQGSVTLAGEIALAAGDHGEDLVRCCGGLDGATPRVRRVPRTTAFTRSSCSSSVGDSSPASLWLYRIPATRRPSVEHLTPPGQIGSDRIKQGDVGKLNAGRIQVATHHRYDGVARI